MVDDVLSKEEVIKHINMQLVKSLEAYRKTMSYMCADAPLGVLCLPKVIETILNRNGIARVYDLFGLDLTKIKGIGDRRRRDLTSRLNEFLAMG
jgi:hypothetical protein